MGRPFMGSPSISASAAGRPSNSGTAFDSSIRPCAMGWNGLALASIRRGYAYISGLRRFRQAAVPSTPHEERGLGNSYVQGTAALVFFDAGNRLRQLYRRHGARLIIPVHDAFVFEAPTRSTHPRGRADSVSSHPDGPGVVPGPACSSRDQHQVPGVLEPRRAPRQRRAVRREPDAGIVIRARNERRGLRRGKEAANES